MLLNPPSLLRPRLPAAQVGAGLATGAALLLLTACTAAMKPQPGGLSTTILGGAAAPTVVANTAPENPQTPSTTTVEKTTLREYLAPSPGDHAAADTAHPPTALTGALTASVHSTSHPINSPAAPVLLRETVQERAATTTGIAQRDTTRELATRLTNLRGVLWVGVALLVGGPLIGWKLGWFTNGCIAGAVGLLLIILSVVIPGHEAWFGLAGLLLIPVVGFVYYRAHYDASLTTPASPSASTPPSGRSVPPASTPSSTV